MNIFTFLSVVMTGISKFTVECCDALTSSASAINKCAQIADVTADAMLKETEAENEQQMIELRAKFAARQLPKPITPGLPGALRGSFFYENTSHM